MKKLARRIVAAVLSYQIRSLSQRNNFKIIAVAGSIGKTSTKLTIAKVLGQNFKVCYQDGNYNDLVSVPLIFFQEGLPGLFNPLAWIFLFWRNQRKLRKPYNYDFVVVELGSDAPGQIIEFKKYLKLEIGVLTAITPEHMENFHTLDGVAKEELSIAEFSSMILANKDYCDDEYLSYLPSLSTYALKGRADYRADTSGGKFTVKASDTVVLEADSVSWSEAEQYSIMAAAAIAHKFGMSSENIKKGIMNIKPVPGRMQMLTGINGSTIIDDSYNASPDAVKLALNSLYNLKASKKIAVLGNMNELGEYSETAHEEIGKLCDTKQLNLVITIGPDANKFLAAAAEAKGCKVERFASPYKAGEYLKPLIDSGTLILVKGSQNKVFAEEVIKVLLKDPEDKSKLVRQTPEWMKIKAKEFKL